MATAESKLEVSEVTVPPHRTPISHLVKTNQPQNILLCHIQNFFRKVITINNDCFSRRL